MLSLADVDRNSRSERDMGIGICRLLLTYNIHQQVKHSLVGLGQWIAGSTGTFYNFFAKGLSAKLDTTAILGIAIFVNEYDNFLRFNSCTVLVTSYPPANVQ